MYVDEFVLKTSVSPAPLAPYPLHIPKHAVLVVWLVFRKTKDINIEHMLGV